MKNMKFKDLYKQQEENKYSLKPFLKIAFLCCTLVVLILISLSVFYTYFEKSPLKYMNLPFNVISTHLKPGDTVAMEVTRCLTESSVKSYRITQTLIPLDEGKPILLGSLRIAIFSNCNTSISMVNILPKQLKPGKYILSGTAEIQGLFKVHTVDWYSESFIVE